MPDRRKLALLFAATLCNFTAAGMYFAAIPLFVTRELGGSNAAAGISVGAFSISAVLLRPSVGRGVDSRGRRPYMLGALGILLVSSLLFLLASSVAAVVAIRLLQGIAGAAFYTTSAAVTTDLTPPERRASAIALLSLFLYGGFAGGPALAEQLIARSGFGLAWGVAAALAAAGMVAAFLLPETGGSAIARRAELGPARRKIIHPAALGPGLVLMCIGVGYVSITAFSSLYARHIGLGSSGALYAVFAFTIIGIRLVVVGGFVDRRARTSVALPGMALGAAGLALLALLQRPVPAFAGVAAFGAGFALVFPALMAFTVDRVPDHERGEALGSYTAFMDIGSGAGSYLVGWMADTGGFGWAYATPALLCAAGFVLLVFVARRHRAATMADVPPEAAVA